MTQKKSDVYYIQYIRLPVSYHLAKNSTTIALLAKSDSYVMFCLQTYQELRIDRSIVYQSYPQDRINTQVIYRFALAQLKCAR